MKNLIQSVVTGWFFAAMGIGIISIPTELRADDWYTLIIARNNRWEFKVDIGHEDGHKTAVPYRRQLFDWIDGNTYSRLDYPAARQELGPARAEKRTYTVYVFDKKIADVVCLIFGDDRKAAHIVPADGSPMLDSGTSGADLKYKFRIPGNMGTLVVKRYRVGIHSIFEIAVE